jgi:hypothetical protein
MSYSFTVVANTKTDANRQIREQFDKIAESQPIHLSDKEAAIVAGQSSVNLLSEPTDNTEIYVNMYGSVSWRDVSNEITAVGLTVNVSKRNKA